MNKLTGTFFCDRTTAQSLPRTPTDMMLAAVIALNAYSVEQLLSAFHACPVVPSSQPVHRS